MGDLVQVALPQGWRGDGVQGDFDLDMYVRSLIVSADENIQQACEQQNAKLIALSKTTKTAEATALGTWVVPSGGAALHDSPAMWGVKADAALDRCGGLGVGSFLGVSRRSYSSVHYIESFNNPFQLHHCSCTRSDM